MRQTDLSKTDGRQTLAAEADSVHLGGSCLSCSQESNNAGARLSRENCSASTRYYTTYYTT